MLQVIITSSVLILILIGLRYLMRGRISQRLQYGLWLLAALRLLLPFQIGSLSISISNLTNDTSTSVNQMMAQPVRQIQATRLEEPRESQPAQTPEAEVNSAGKTADAEAVPPMTAGPNVTGQTANSGQPATPDVLPERQTAEAREPVTVGQVLQLVWLSGVGLMALWFLGVNLLYNRRVRRSAEPWAVEGSPIPVMVSDAIQSPCLLGFFRPRVYLTMACASDPEATRHVLAHELTHYRHGDLLWSVVRSACLCLHWYNPLVWWAASLSRRDCELACDEGALRKLGEGERLPYGRTLITMIARASTPVNLLQTATTMAANKKQLKERVVMIAKKRKLYTVVTVVLLLVVCTVAGCTFAGAEIKPTLDSLDDVQRIPSKQTEPDDTEEPSTEPPETEPSEQTGVQESARSLEGYIAQKIPFVSRIITVSDLQRGRSLVDPDPGWSTMNYIMGWSEAVYDAEGLLDELRYQVRLEDASTGLYIELYDCTNYVYVSEYDAYVPMHLDEDDMSYIVSLLHGRADRTVNRANPLYQVDYTPEGTVTPNVVDVVNASYTDIEGKSCTLRIPKIEMLGPNVEEINAEIFADLEVHQQEDGEHAAWYKDIYYRWTVNGDILSLVIVGEENMNNPEVDAILSVYNLSVSQCRLLSSDEVYSAAGISDARARVSHAIVSYHGERMVAAQKRMAEAGAPILYFTDEGGAALGLFERDISEENFNTAQPYLDENGRLCVAAYIHTIAGAGYESVDICVENYDTDVLYSAEEYYNYYAQLVG